MTVRPETLMTEHPPEYAALAQAFPRGVARMARSAGARSSNDPICRLGGPLSALFFPGALLMKIAEARPAPYPKVQLARARDPPSSSEMTAAKEGTPSCN